MLRLFHFTLCPYSRFVRIALGEYGNEPALIEQYPWRRNDDFLLLNPSGALPVLIDGDRDTTPVCGAGPIAEFLDETLGATMKDWRLLPEDPFERAEVRRLMDWFNAKFAREVSDYLLVEKVHKRFRDRADGESASPDSGAIRAARTNIRYHMRYIGHLTDNRRWMAGRQLSYADLAAAAHLSCLDYLGEIPWDEDESAKLWYARLKSRPSMRPMLAERLQGISPAPWYADLDF